MTTILVVTDRYSVKRRFADALLNSGFGVVHCAGPEPPDYSCAHEDANGVCGHAHLADAALLDGDLAGDAMEKGPSSRATMERYRSRDLPLVVLIGPEDVQSWIGDQEAVVLSRKTPTHKVISALSDVIRRHAERRSAAAEHDRFGAMAAS